MIPATFVSRRASNERAGDGIMALKVYLAAALLFGLVAWLLEAGSQRTVAEKQALASQYKLNSQQMTVYDKCIGAMEHKGLRAGGSNQQFCGCMVQRGLGDLQSAESDAVLGWIRNSMPRETMVTNGQEKVLMAAFTCSEDTRRKWASAAELKSWCAETDVRRGLSQCKLGLK
jgi:hypothetical protein